MKYLPLLKNVNTLVLCSSFSCTLTFLVRLQPELYWPVVMLEVSLVLYCLHESLNSVFFRLIVAGLVFGVVCGNSDYLELLFKFDSERIISTITTIVISVLMILCLILLIVWSRRQDG